MAQVRMAHVMNIMADLDPEDFELATGYWSSDKNYPIEPLWHSRTRLCR
jgi:hypothetical protein